VAVAIWSMHFVAMLAARLPFPVDYLVLPTLLSFLVCVIVVGAAVFAASAGPPSPPRLAASAIFMGSGIVSMHYIGMWALHASAHMTHAPLFVAASVAIAIAVSGLAIFLAGGRTGRPPLILSAAALGSAISGMHYTAMAGLSVMPHQQALTDAPALSTDLLAIVVAVVAFGVSGLFLLTLVPAQPLRTPAADSKISPRMAAGQSANAAPELVGARSEAHPLAIALTQAELIAPEVPMAAAAAAHAPQAVPARLLPVVRDGANQFIAVKDIVAVHANAHYTYLFDGTCKLFCPLPIGAVEARLDAAHFARVHRSHIVNLERVVGLKRNGDHGLIQLSGHDPYTVPVSRSRFGGLKSQLGLGAREAVS
jgi:NO-binding membrane sensor protein with MHYT domain